MKKQFALYISLIALCTLYACVSSVTVLDAWKSDKAHTLRDKKILVIAVSESNAGRSAFEEEITRQLTKNHVEASTSYMKFPILNEDRKLDKEAKKEFVAKINKMGFNAIIVTVVKQRNELSKTIEHGDYYSGGSYSEIYPQYYGGFYGYYNHPNSHPTYGNYVPSSTETITEKHYVLETVIYNLDLPENEQLIAVVTSAVNDPKNAHEAAKEYVKKITKILAKN